MFNLRLFFQYGRKPYGSFMSEHENVQNAVARNLSTYPDPEIIQLREEARAFIAACDETLSGRDMDD